MLPGRAGTICAVRAWRFVRLFARIFGPAEKLDVAEIEAMGLSPLPDPEPFRIRFAHLYAGFGGRPVGEQSLTTQMMRTIRMAVESGLEFPAGAFPVIKSLMYLDGMALACAAYKVLLDDVAKFAGDFGESG